MCLTVKNLKSCVQYYPVQKILIWFWLWSSLWACQDHFSQTENWLWVRQKSDIDNAAKKSEEWCNMRCSNIITYKQPFVWVTGDVVCRRISWARPRARPCAGTRSPASSTPGLMTPTRCSTTTASSSAPVRRWEDKLTYDKLKSWPKLNKPN